jgi:hypothetical protein
MLSDYPKLELKYCERCGGLWLRPQGTDAVYCAACAENIRELPPSRGGTPSGTLQAGCLVALAAVILPVSTAFGGTLA